MRVLAIADGNGEDERVFIRGDHRQPGEVAPRAFLSAYCDDPTLDLGAGSGRLALAERLLDDSDPLPARVMVNRVWHHLLGRGIVPTTDDFGLLGASPTHPELLDFLADRFRHEMGWSTKTLVREIVLSSTYRMASGPPSERASLVDPQNTLYSWREPRRLEGEAIRDAVLAVSGRLDERMYGPSVPTHLTDFMTGRGRPDSSGPLDGDGRRTIYLEVRRNFLDPMMQAFDAPVPHSTMGRRLESNVPAQSLILMNGPFVVGQSRLLADRLFDECPTSAADRVDRLYLLTLGRPCTAEERDASTAFLRRQARERSGAGADWRTDREAWADLCHVMFNLKEFAYVR